MAEEGVRVDEHGVLGHPLGVFPCRKLFLVIVNDKFCNMHNVFNTVGREKQCGSVWFCL